MKHISQKKAEDYRNTLFTFGLLFIVKSNPISKPLTMTNSCKAKMIPKLPTEPLIFLQNITLIIL